MTLGWPRICPCTLFRLFHLRQFFRVLAMGSVAFSMDSVLPPQAEGLVFDLDGTVLDTMGAHWQAWKQLMGELGLTFTHEQFLNMAGKPTRTILAELCSEQGRSDVDVPSASQRKTAIYQEHTAGVEPPPIECVMAVLRAGRARGLKCAVATGGSRDQVISSLRKAGLYEAGTNLKLFDAVVTANDVAHGKPHPETYLKAAAAIGVDPAKCVGYEDAPMGMESIRAAGYLLAVDVTKMEGYPQLQG